MSLPDGQGSSDVELSLVSKTRKHKRSVIQEEHGSAPSKSSGKVNMENERDDASTVDGSDHNGDGPNTSLLQHDQAQDFLAKQAEQDQNFTVRGVLVGLAIGVIICFSNTYFGLQTGWVSGMAMPAALIGFGFFKTISRCINYPFTPVENVLVQTVAGAVGTMPLGCGFVGVMPALNFLLTSEENGPIIPKIGPLIFWAIGICFFGVVLAVPLRKEVIIREKLKFPSGTATALVIGVVHGNTDEKGKVNPDSGMEIFRQRSLDIRRSISTDGTRPNITADNVTTSAAEPAVDVRENELDHRDDWKANIRLMIYAFAVSALYTLTTYFIPQLRSLPILGIPMASKWLWSLNPSPAYVGQGIIMGPATTLHMLLGAVVGWGILSPLAKYKGWAPGPVSEWSTGSKGWIVWVSLAIMLADSVINLGWLILRTLIDYGPSIYSSLRQRYKTGGFQSLLSLNRTNEAKYRPLQGSDHDSTKPQKSENTPEPDAPPHHLVSNRLVAVLLVLSLLLCIISVRVVFPSVPIGATILAIIIAILLSIMGVRALGETDLNPVSGISKLSQLFFALVIPSSNPNAVIINLIAGAISESAALQAGDMMQDLKTGHLLGAAPKAQFWGQMIGSLAGAVISACVYKLYTSVYQIPGSLFETPTAFVWIFTARLVTGKGLPEKASEWAFGAGALFVILTVLRIRGQGTTWQPYIPGGIAVAIGMYNVPSFTLARTIGGLIHWYWTTFRGKDETPVIVLASGLILGEGLISIVNLGLASGKVPHL